MKICFVQKQPFPYFGIMSMAGWLRNSGIGADVVITGLETDYLRALKESAPDVIGISSLSTERGWLERTAGRIREEFPGVPMVAGGVHAILYPEDVLSIPAIDFVCTGEGERTLVSLCEALRDRAPLAGIRGIGYRVDGTPVIHERAPLLPDLDAFPEERAVYYGRYRRLRDDEQKQFLSSRGCPHRCAFCYNDRLHEIFPGEWDRVRRKSPERLVSEIEAARGMSPVRSIFFADDLFASDKGWLEEFGRLYRDRVGIPFMSVTRADRVDAETAGLLRQAGCRTVSFGVESGNERLRERILGKGISDEAIARCAGLLRENGIGIQTSNMFCLPDETLEDAWETIRLNIRIRADYAFAPLFLPFPGTRLAAYCTEKGYLPADFGFDRLPESFLTRSVLDLPDRKRIENLQRIAHFLVRYPSLLKVAEPLVRRLTASWFYVPFLFAGTLLRYKEERDLSTWGAAAFLWRFRNSF